LSPENETPAGTGPTGASREKAMKDHCSLLPKIVAILRIRVKIVIARK
jgi:hypothetical protein